MITSPPNNVSCKYSIPFAHNSTCCFAPVPMTLDFPYQCSQHVLWIRTTKVDKSSQHHWLHFGSLPFSQHQVNLFLPIPFRIPKGYLIQSSISTNTILFPSHRTISCNLQICNIGHVIPCLPTIQIIFPDEAAIHLYTQFRSQFSDIYCSLYNFLHV